MTNTTKYQPFEIHAIPEEEEEEEEESVKRDDVLLFQINPEYFRIVAYVNFWLMVIFAMILTKIFVDPDKVKNSPLVETFGYNNICIFWDYEPSRVLTSMVYPFVELPLLAYIIMNFLRIRETYLEQQQLLKRREYILCWIFFPISFILTIYFRMIFVIEAFNNLIGHTLPFQGLMVALVLVSIQNYLYNKATNNVPFPKKKWISETYLSLLIIITSLKLIIVWTIFLGFPILDPKSDFGSLFSQSMDICWLVLAAIIPLLLAIYQRNKTGKFKIVLGD